MSLYLMYILNIYYYFVHIYLLRKLHPMSNFEEPCSGGCVTFHGFYMTNISKLA